jgi:hypothetical protein
MIGRLPSIACAACHCCRFDPFRDRPEKRITLVIGNSAYVTWVIIFAYRLEEASSWDFLTVFVR